MTRLNVCNMSQLQGIVMLFQNDYKLFAVFYTFGNVTALAR